MKKTPTRHFKQILVLTQHSFLCIPGLERSPALLSYTACYVTLNVFSTWLNSILEEYIH